MIFLFMETFGEWGPCNDVIRVEKILLLGFLWIYLYVILYTLFCMSNQRKEHECIQTYFGLLTLRYVYELYIQLANKRKMFKVEKKFESVVEMKDGGLYARSCKRNSQIFLLFVIILCRKRKVYYATHHKNHSWVFI